MKGNGYAVYTNIVPSGAFRGYGSSQTVFAVESAMGDLARELGMNLMELQRKNVVVPATPCTAFGKGHPTRRSVATASINAWISSSKALASGRGSAKPEGDEWLEGKGHAIHMHDCIPPTEQRSEAHSICAPMARTISPTERRKWATEQSQPCARSPQRS